MNQFTVKLQNISVSHPQKAWVSMGLPQHVATTCKNKIGHVYTEDGKAFPAAVRGDELFVQAELGPNQVAQGKCILDQEGESTFTFSDWTIDQPEKLIPRFGIKDTSGNLLADIPMVFWDGKGEKPQAYFTFQESFDVRMRVFFHTKITQVPMVIEGWIDFYNNQDAASITVRATYSNVADPAKQLNKQMGSLSMFTGEKVTIDFRRSKGLHEAVFRTDLNLWETELASPRTWWRARVIECFGAMLCLPPYDKLAEELQKPGNLQRFTWLKAREEAPMAGIALVWDQHFLATGKTPEKPINERNLANLAYQSLLNRINNYGDEYNPRAYAQPPNSGQTGAQPDFGVSRGELVVTSHQPWALWDYRFSVQAWMLRPYAHKEADGTALKAANHPNTLLYNLAVDTRFGSDLLGFPNPIPYNEFWTGSDNQHRSDNLLFAMYALTRDPSLKATIEDLIEVNKMEIKTWRLWGQPDSIESPRGWGRPLLSMAHAYALGFEEVKADMLEMLDTMYKGASMFKIPQQPDRTVRTLSNRGFKYGWTKPDGNMIRAWVCWEEAIAAIGLWAVYKVTQDERAKTLALEIGKTITKHGFFKASNNNWYSCYCVRWDEANPGKPLPDSAYNLNPNNQDVVVYGMHQWMLPAIRIMLEIEPSCVEATRGKQILNFFGMIPYDYNDSCWWAV